MAAVATGSFTWQMRASATLANAAILLTNASGTEAMNVAFTSSGNMIANNFYGNATSLGSYSANQWYLIEVQFDATNQSQKFRIRRDGGTFTAWLNFANTLTASQVEGFAIYDDNAGVAHDFWIDTINDSPPVPLIGFEIRRNTLQAGSAANTAILDTGASATNNFYNGDAISITTGTGAEQFAVIGAYNGTTKVATINPPWVTVPTASGYLISPRSGGIVLRQNTATGGDGSHITLDAGANATNGYYARPGSAILLTSGTAAGQLRVIVNYNGTTKIATVDHPWLITPLTGTMFTIFVR